MIEDVIYLVKERYKADNIGNQIPAEEITPMFAAIYSVSQSEYFEAGKNGLKPDYKMMIYSQEYSGEQKVRYENTAYTIYRTYLCGDRLELYLTKRDGTQHD